MKKCPYCAEDIRDEAIVCRYCRRDIAPEPTETLPMQQGAALAASGDAMQSGNQAAKTSTAARKPKWKQIGATVLLAGAIPITLGVLVLRFFDAVGLGSPSGGLHPLVYATYLFAIFLFHLLPLPLGFWAGLAWPGTHLWGHTLLGFSAGLVEVITGWAVSKYLVSAELLRPIDYMFALGTISLFIAGGLFGDLFEKILGWRRFRDLRYISQLWRHRALDHGYGKASHDTLRPEPKVRGSHRTVDAPAAGFSPKQVLLIQTMVPGTFVLTGTIITAIVTFLSTRY